MSDDLISRSALLDIVGKMPLVWEYGHAVSDIYDIIKSAPAVDAESVQHSMWLEHPGAQKTKYWTCLNCDTMGSPRWKRCPVCEAKMEAMKYE